MIYLCRAMMINLIIIVVFATTTTAQPRPIDVYIQDSIGVWLVTENGDTIPPSWVSPAYEYLMSYGSTCQTEFIFTECKQNGELLKLLSWNDGRRVHAPAELMSFNSRTVNFLVRAGDTISFYRDMSWINPSNNRMDTNNYYALDTLEMITYLVHADDGRPLAQLDSLGVLPRTTPGMPTIYGTRPIIALVSYVVPPSLDGDSVLVEITVRARGAGPHHFMRRDGITVGLSERLKDAWWQSYLAAYGSVYAKRSVDELMQISGEEGIMLNATSVPGSPRDLRIIFNGPKGGGFTAVAIYDEAGSLVFYPYNSRTDAAQLETAYRMSQSGAYFVTLAHNGRVVKTQKIIIAQ